MTNEPAPTARNSEFLLINLDRSTDRLTRSSELLKEHGIGFHRISAVDGRELSAETLSDALAPDFSGYYKVLTSSEVGCYLSHKKCWQYLIDQNLDYAVILEDDFSVNDSLAKIDEYIASIDAPWDYIKLMEYPEKRNVIWSAPCIDRQLVRYDKIPIRSCAYVITQSCAKKMLAAHSKIARPVDVDCQYWWESNISVYGLKPYIFSVNLHTESTIDGGGSRKSSNKRIIKKYLQKLMFTINNYRHSKNQKRSSL